MGRKRRTPRPKRAGRRSGVPGQQFVDSADLVIGVELGGLEICSDGRHFSARDGRQGKKRAPSR